LNSLDVGDGFADVCLSDLMLFARVAVNGLLVSRFGLIRCALAFVQGVGHLIEPRLRRIPARGQLASTIVVLLGQDHARLGSLQRRLARRDHLRPRACVDVGELRLGYNLGGQRLLVLGNCLRVVDLDQHGAGVDVLAALDGNLRHAPVNPGSQIEARRVDLALHKERLRSHQIPYREASNGGDHHTYDDRGKPGG
jgi:hypothetical protein